MPNNQNKNGKGGGTGGRRNTTAIVSILLWALVIVVLFNYVTSIAQKANTEEISYSTFKQMVRDGQVAKVVIESNKFTIYPSEWSEDFGSNIYDNSDTHLRSFMAHHRQNGAMEAPTPYGWTVGLNLPTLKTVRETIEMMKQEMVG